MGDFPAYFREETIAWRAERDRTNPILTREQIFAREALRTSVAEFVKLKSGFALSIKDRGRRLGSLVARGWLSETEITRAFLQAADRSGIFARETEKALEAYLNEGLRIGFKSPAPDLDEPPEKSEPEKPEDAHSKSEDTSIDPIKALEEMNEIYASVSIGGKFRVMTFGPHALYSLQVNPVFSTKQDF